MEYSHSFIVKSSLERVHQFHINPHTLKLLTPLPIKLTFKKIPTLMVNDTIIEFTLRFLILPIHWKAKINKISGNGFIDEQIEGPFNRWHHIHHYFQLDSEHILITDTIFADLKNDIGNRLIGILMFYSLPLLFLYRKYTTQKKLKM